MEGGRQREEADCHAEIATSKSIVPPLLLLMGPEEILSMFTSHCGSCRGFLCRSGKLTCSTCCLQSSSGQPHHPFHSCSREWTRERRQMFGITSRRPALLQVVAGYLTEGRRSRGQLQLASAPRRKMSEFTAKKENTEKTKVHPLLLFHLLHLRNTNTKALQGH